MNEENKQQEPTKKAWSIAFVMWRYFKWILIPVGLILSANFGAFLGKCLWLTMTYFGVEDNFARFMDWLIWF